MAKFALISLEKSPRRPDAWPTLDTLAGLSVIKNPGIAAWGVFLFQVIENKGFPPPFLESHTRNRLIIFPSALLLGAVAQETVKMRSHWSLSQIEGEGHGQSATLHR